MRMQPFFCRYVLAVGGGGCGLGGGLGGLHFSPFRICDCRFRPVLFSLSTWPDLASLLFYYTSVPYREAGVLAQDSLTDFFF